MKKLFTLVTLLAAAFGIANAATTNYTCESMGGKSTTNTDFTVTFGDYSMALAKGSGATAPVYNATGKDLRTYAKNTLTLTTTGETFNTVVFNISTAGMRRLTDIAASTGSVTVDATAKTATWTGNAVTTVTFVVGDAATYGSDGATKGGQLDFTSIDITTGSGAAEETVAKPSFSVAAGTYYCTQTVSLYCGTSGSTIYYTTDGTTPTTSSTVYSEALTISSTTTVKALAVKGEKQSAVAEAAYVIGTPAAVANIAAFKAADDDTYVQFTNTVSVLAHNGKNIYVKDDSGYGFFYGDVLNGKTYKNGDVIPAGFVGKKVTYNNEPELSCYPTDGFKAAASNSPIDAEEITTAGVVAQNFGHYVVIKEAKLSYINKTITDATGTAPIRTGMGGYGSTTDTTKVYDVIAVIGSAKDGDDVVYVALPVKLTETGTGGGGETTEGVTIAEFQALADNATATFKNPVVVQAAYGGRTFVKDETGYMLIFGNTGKTYTQGNVIPAGFSGVKTTYDGEPELKQTFAGFQDATSTVAVTAETLTASMMAHENFGHYVVAKNVTINTTTKCVYFENGDSVKFYNNLGANLPSDLTKKYDVYGIIGSYGKTNTIYQLLTSNITEAGGGEIALQEVPNVAGLYNLDKGVNAKITGDLQVIYQNGKNMYVKSDDTYTLVFGYLSNKFENGDVINNAVASWTLYNDAKQLTPVDSTFVLSKKGDAVEPTEIALEEVGTDMVHNYLLIKNATLVADTIANTYFISDETLDKVKLYNKFTSTVTMPEELEGKTFNVSCFVTVYNGTIELYPIAVEDTATPDPGIPGDVNNDGAVDVSDVNIIINIILGNDQAENYGGRADVTGDGAVDVSDINVILNKILGITE